MAINGEWLSAWTVQVQRNREAAKTRGGPSIHTRIHSLTQSTIQYLLGTWKGPGGAVQCE